MGTPDSQFDNIDIDKGNSTDNVNIRGDYYQIHGDFINSTDLSDPAPNNSKRRATIIFEIEGHLDDVDPIQLKLLLRVLRRVSKDGSVMMRDIQKGSIKITLKGSESGIWKILRFLEEEQEIANFAVKNIRAIHTFALKKYSTDQKINAAEEIKSLSKSEVELGMVTQPISSDQIGQILWHGRYVAAQLLDSQTTDLQIGAVVVIVGVVNGYYAVVDAANIFVNKEHGSQPETDDGIKNMEFGT